MYRFLIFAYASLIAASLSAQSPCDPNALAGLPGKWKPAGKGSVTPLNAKDVATEKATLNSIFNMIKAGYQPVGLAIDNSDIIGFNPATGTNWVCNPYAKAFYLIDYFCEGGTARLNGENETPNSVFIYANSMEWIANIYGCQPDEDNTRGYVYMKDMPVYRDGYYFFDLGDEKPKHSSAILIARDGAVPFSYVTRKEFLDIRIAELEKKKKTEMDRSLKNAVIRPAAEQEAAKQKELDELRHGNYSQSYINRFLNDYKTDEQKRDLDLQRTAKYYDEPLQRLRSALSHSSAAELAQPAIISGQDTYDGFTDFVPDEKGTCLVKPNLAYYKKNLPKTAPQFFCVFYSWDEHDTVSVKAVDGIRKALDLGKLKEMIK